MDSVLLIVFSYLLGSILFGEHIAKLKGVDIRSVGSGNVGATNVGRVLGRKYAVLVFLLDAFKGFFPILLSRLYFGLDSWTTFFVGLACVLGHMYPIFHDFRGGKGVATASGVLLGVSPLTFLLSMIFWTLLVKLKGYVSLASMGSSLFATLLLLLQGYDYRVVFMSLFITMLIVYRHKDNIKRLLEGTEHRVRL
ncbi:glycerol-3-phosphate 1-O-acyltransferase PlsY [Thermocrinis minervae]|uniref:Glycerol-3-phosphate acyltransferase n=1 Tax=Thermocrinis minervae TaxID=381751 RepID=A0A1M6SV41_9AQUI|nr:glycerol-3-phosphate 1-O-acyltransferase PlsY [Thermocrinis minervae]SHK48591.1 glycerol-3-phosphate acyltransferase PlsY [Thermocrinis minervae]